jgi:O-antigen ligase
MVLREFQQGTVTASRLSSAWIDGDTAGRTTIYKAAWSMFLEKPLMGYGGVNNFAMLGVHLNFADGDMFYRSTHNLLLALLTEVGLVGAVPFLAAIIYAVWKAWRYGRRSDDGMPFALMCALVTINVSLTWDHAKIFWIIVAAAAACGSERRPPFPENPAQAGREDAYGRS